MDCQLQALCLVMLAVAVLDFMVGPFAFRIAFLPERCCILLVYEKDLPGTLTSTRCRLVSALIDGAIRGVRIKFTLPFFVVDANQN